MKTVKFLLTFLVIGMLAVTTKAQNIDEILKKHAEAIGGLENWAKIKTMKMDMVMKMQGMEIPIVATQVNCSAMRTDITVMGMSGYSIITKTNGWNFMPFQGQTKPEPMTEDILKSSQDELCLIDKLLRYKETGDKVEYLGTDDVDGTECLKLKLTDATGKESTYFLDSESNLLIKKTVKVMVNGQVVENSASMGNYQKQDGGIIVAMSMKTGGGEMEVKKITINPEVDENIFKLPN
jgi:peptide deformylase